MPSFKMILLEEMSRGTKVWSHKVRANEAIEGNHKVRDITKRKKKKPIKYSLML